MMAGVSLSRARPSTLTTPHGSAITFTQPCVCLSPMDFSRADGEMRAVNFADAGFLADDLGVIFSGCKGKNVNLIIENQCKNVCFYFRL